MIRILSVDDQPACHQAISLLLNDYGKIKIAGSALNGVDLLEQLLTLNPDVVLMDINMPVMDGVEATRLALQLYPHLKILAYTIFGEEDRIIEMMDAGAKGYVLKTGGSSSLVQGIFTVMEGGTYYCSSASETMLHFIKRHTRSYTAAAAPFTDVEKAMLRLISEGCTSQQIAAALFISTKTEEKYRAGLFLKAGAKNAAELVAYAYKNGLCRPDKDNEKQLRK
ncbi:response regulator [Niabella hirudinis]|uniref:response regulator n=1 Tax=Niabella hirudinis TaxID=1285929 RepID=UPI003EBC798C